MIVKLLSFGMSNPLFKEAMKVRKAVFVDEMGIPPDFDFDGKDPDAAHFLLTVNDKPVGAARWIETEEGIKIERLAIVKDFRGQGLGHFLLRQVVRDVLPSKKKIYLYTPVLLKPFFEWNGFEPEGQEFDEAGVPHIKMVYTKLHQQQQEQKNLFTNLFKRKKN